MPAVKTSVSSVKSSAIQGGLNSQQSTRPLCNTLDHFLKSQLLDYLILIHQDGQSMQKDRASNTSRSGAPLVFPAKLPRILDRTKFGLVRERSYPGLLRGAVENGGHSRSAGRQLSHLARWFVGTRSRIVCSVTSESHALRLQYATSCPAAGMRRQNAPCR